MSLGIPPDRLPRHVAIIMDGNGRWAEARGLPRTRGHEAGERALFDVVEGALEAGIGFLSVYAFSTENWARPADEVDFLLGFNRSLLRQRRDELNERGVRIRFMGRRDRRLPKSVQKEMQAAEAMTEGNTRMTLVIALNYGGRAELVDAVQSMVEDPPRRVDGRAIAKRLYLPDVPDPDLLIRTSGEMRISNFLLWQAAYAELWFTPVLWPDFGREHLFEAIRDYQKRERRFGKVAD